MSCYHGIDVPDPACTFEDRSVMRSAIWSAIAEVWLGCTAHQLAFEPGMVVDVTSAETGEIPWNVYREPLFDQYLGLLHNVSSTDLTRDDNPSVVDISSVVMLEAMGGKGCSKRVQVQLGSAAPEIFVIKDVDFKDYLQIHDDDDDFAHHTVETWRRSSKLKTHPLTTTSNRPRGSSCLPAVQITSRCSSATSQPSSATTLSVTLSMRKTRAGPRYLSTREQGGVVKYLPQSRTRTAACTPTTWTSNPGTLSWTMKEPRVH